MPETLETKEERQALFARLMGVQPSKAELRRMALVEATIDHIAIKGADGLTLEAVGKRCKMTKAHVAYYYSNRDKLIRAAIGLVISVGQSFTVDGIDQDEKPIPRLKKYIEGHIRWLIRYPNHAQVMLLFYYFSSVKVEFAKLHEEIRETGAKRIILLLKTIYPKDKPSELKAKAKYIQALLTGHLLDHFTQTNPPSLEKLKAKLDSEIMSYLDQ